MDHYRKGYPIGINNDSTSGSSSASSENTFVFGKAFQRRVKFEDTTTTGAKTKTFKKKSSSKQRALKHISESSDEESFWEKRNKNKKSTEQTLDLKKQEEFKERLMQLVQDNLSQQSKDINPKVPSTQQQHKEQPYRPGSSSINQVPPTTTAAVEIPQPKSILKPRRYIYTTPEDYEEEEPIPYNGVKVSSLVASRLLSAHGIRWVTPYDGDIMTPLQQKMVAGTERLPLSRFLQNIPLPVRRSIAEIGRDSKKFKSPWRFQ